MRHYNVAAGEMSATVSAWAAWAHARARRRRLGARAVARREARGAGMAFRRWALVAAAGRAAREVAARREEEAEERAAAEVRRCRLTSC